MPTSVKAHGTVIALLAIFHSLSVSASSTKLSVVSQSSSANTTRRHYVTKTNVSSSANYSLAHRMYPRRRSKFFSADTNRDTHIPDYGYNWHQQQQQPYSLWPDYTYHDYQVTSLPDLTTIVYPRLTTAQPPLLRHHQYDTALRPKVTKLYVKPYRRTVNFLDLDDEPEQQLPLRAWYSGGGLYRWPSAISSLPASVRMPTYSQPAIHSDERISSIEHYPGAIGHQAPVIYHHHHDGGHSSEVDLKHIGIIALVKIGLAKLKIFGILKLLFVILLKFKLLLLILFIKFVLFLKAIKKLKALLIPLLALLGMLLIPLILLALMLPLFLLRYLLPLLLLLPIPGPARIRGTKTENRLLEYLKTQRSDPIMDIMAQLMEAETCVERISCQLATRKESRLLYPIIKWYLNKMKNVLKHGRLVSYVEAYIKSAEAYENSEDWESIDGRQWCKQKHSCVQPESSSEKLSSVEESSTELPTTTETTNYVMINRVTYDSPKPSMSILTPHRLPFHKPSS